MKGDYRLLIDADVVDFVASLKPADRRLLSKRMRQIQEFPSNYCDYIERDSVGRLIQVHLVGRYAIEYWEDFADRHVKVLVLRHADG
jgi:mRNA-degrading endonuclease RelE of RelBE toxin-antitoxin system